jgi:hypothetical protein
MQEDFNQIYEHFDDSQILEGENEMRSRLEQRMTKLNRFSPVVIEKALKNSVGGWQGKI